VLNEQEIKKWTTVMHAEQAKAEELAK